MRILHVVPYLPKASGVTTFVVELSDALQSDIHNQTVAVCDSVSFEVAESRHGVPRISVSEALHGINDGEYSIVHLHGIWSPFMHKVVIAATRRAVPIVWSMHGMLSPWAMKYKRWKKAPVWWLWQKRDLLKATLIHATSEQECSDIARRGLSVPTTSIPLGTCLHDPIPWDRRENTVLFVGRLNPIKAIDNLINAWRLMIDVSDDIVKSGWTMRIVGSYDIGYRQQLESLAYKLGVSDSVKFIGPLYCNELDAEYKKAKLLVLPSHTENFGGVVVDALSWGVPVVASTNTPWRVLEEAECGRWVSNSPNELGKVLRNLLSLGDRELYEMGGRGRKLVEERYTWGAVADQMLAAYKGIR